MRGPLRNREGDGNRKEERWELENAGSAP